MRIAYWIPKATNKYPEYVIFIAFPLQQRLHESSNVIRTLPVLLNVRLIIMDFVPQNV
jgi:hypothetical protein